MKTNYFPPEFRKTTFTCPYCGVLAQQEWGDITDRFYDGGFGSIYQSKCKNEDCLKSCLWIDEKMVLPDQEGIPFPNDDLAEDIRKDYLEARSIVNKSPRGAAALLRLCIQKLCKQLGESGKDLNADIASLVKKGLRQSIQQSLDIVRVTGNEAVHPGVIDLKDNREIALKLFELVNLIAEVLITESKRIDELYEIVVPQVKKEAIAQRDKDCSPDEKEFEGKGKR